MNSRRMFYFLLANVLVIAMLLGAFQANAGSAHTVNAFLQDPDETCYVVADQDGGPPGNDLLSVVDRVAGIETPIGPPGTMQMEAIAYHAPTDTLYGADADQLGTLDLTTGDFSPSPNTFGTANGSLGPITMSDVDSLGFDPSTGIFYGVSRRRAADQDDLLFQINRETGQHVDNAFGTGIDYLVVDGGYPMNDIDDIAIDPESGLMYAIANNSGEEDHLVVVDKTTGHITEVGIFSVEDMEGLTFDTSGQLIGTTGDRGTAATRDRLWEIDKNSGSVILNTSIPLTEATDYEGVVCLLEWQPQEPTPTPTNTSTPTPTNTPTPTPTQPTAVELLYFRGVWLGGTRAELSWATGMEIDNYGFNIYRAPANDFNQAELIHFEPASEGSGGSEYSYTDTAPSEGAWWYWLADVDTLGKETLHGPVEAKLGADIAFSHRLYVPLLLLNP